MRYTGIVMRKDDAIELLQGEYGKFLLENMMNYVSAISWGSFNNGHFSIQSNGTVFFLNLGSGPLLVTAAHVYEAYLAAKTTLPNFNCLIGDLEFDLESRLICSLGSKALDIATFSINEDEIKRLNKHQTYGAAAWPIERVNAGDGVIIAGFPGLERNQLGPQEYEFGLYVALTPVSSVSERNFGCHFQRENWIDTLGLGFPDEDYSMGGMSGGPAFLYKEPAGGIATWDLAGVIYQAGNADAEIVLLHHSEFILPDGKLVPADPLRRIFV